MATHRDRLSQLSYNKTVKMLGPRGAKLLIEGGKIEINPVEQVQISRDVFRLKLPDAFVSIVDDPLSPNRMRYFCSSCETLCEHIGAAFSTVLEMKSALKLAVPPDQEVDPLTLSEDELVRRELARRTDRAASERMVVRSIKNTTPWTDYTITSRETGKTYRVALRGMERGESYCTCPDYRKNTLGICKHIMKVQSWVSGRFTSRQLDKPFIPDRLAVYVCYGDDMELRLQMPPVITPQIRTLFGRFQDKPITDIPALMHGITAYMRSDGDAVIYPDAERYIHERLHQVRLERLVSDIRRDPAAHDLRKTLLSVELLPYQLDGIAFAVGAGRAVLADDMGLGKTIQAIGCAELLARECGISHCLIVCPTSLKSQWRNEIGRFCNRSVQMVAGAAADRMSQYVNESFYTICNYEQVLRDLEYVEKAPWDFIILDEGQRIKNWEAKTSRTIKALRSRYALVLSGTPLENRLEELYSVVEFIDDRRLGPDFRFHHQHRVSDGTGRSTGYKNLHILRERLKPVLLRRTRSSVMQQLPPRTVETIRITPTAEQLDIHESQMRVINQIVHKAFLTEMDLLRLQKALLIARMCADSTFLVTKKNPSYSTKLEHLTELLGKLISEKDRKIIIFSEWTTMLNCIEPILKKEKAGFVRLDGSVPQKHRQALVTQFQSDPECRVFLATNAGATGLNLQAANTVVNVDLPWNPAILEQRIARAHRMGQKRPVQVYLLITEGTIEERMLGTLAMKHDLAMAALDPESDVTAVSLTSGMEALKNKLEKLLGTKPEAPEDVSLRQQVENEAQALQKRQRIEEAGGQLLGGAFALLREMIPLPQDKAPAVAALSESIRNSLERCMEKDADGRVVIKLAFKDNSGLEMMSQALAVLATAAGR